MEVGAILTIVSATSFDASAPLRPQDGAEIYREMAKNPSAETSGASIVLRLSAEPSGPSAIVTSIGPGEMQPCQGLRAGNQVNRWLCRLQRHSLLRSTQDV